MEHIATADPYSFSLILSLPSLYLIIEVRMDSLQDPFFSNLIHDGSNLGNQFMESQYVSQVGEVAQKESQFSVETESVARKRGGNFSIEEDNMLVSAWLNISLDAIQGNGQKHKTFWTRVWEFFHENKTFTSARNDNSLMNRWSIIQLSTNKFCGYLAQVEAAHQSGMTEQDKIREAKIMYQDLDVKHFAFQFEHCWDVLKHQPKWFQECEKKKPKRGRTVATPVAELVNPEEDVADDIIEVERPIGNKIAKEQRKKKKTNDHASAPIVQVLNELKEDKKAANEKKHQMLQISYSLQAEKLKMEQLKEEARIMMLDTSGMLPMQQEYIHQRQMEIVESRKSKS